MTSTEPIAGPPSLWEAPAPVLLNTWKHHAAFLRAQIQSAAEVGPAALPELAGKLIVVGTELMDLYYGPFNPAQIGARVQSQLQASGRLEEAPFAEWVKSAGGYQVLEFPEDGSKWVLRYADDVRYIHVHPGRWAPQTRRVRANVLKTAVLVLAHAALHGGDALDRDRVNAVRRTYLGLAPVGRELAGDQGVGAVIDLLK
jgi:hypothetical protein